MPSWANEFDICTLYADLPENAGPVSEVVFCHRPTKTLIATDAVVFIPSKAPSIFGTYFDSSQVQQDDFWPKTVLQSVFLPLRTEDTGGDVDALIGSYHYPGFQALEGRLSRAPILRAFTDARDPDAVRKWIRQVSNYDFNRILTSHFASPIAAIPQDFVDAFSYLNGQTQNLPKIACQDWQLLNGLNQFIDQNKLGAPVVFDFQQGCQN
eukprot:scaffold358780_cov63-Attheya_sp.AAC.1